MHPTPENLREYLLGQLPEPAAEEIATHLEACGECEATVASLDQVADTVVSQLAQPAVSDTFAKEGELARALDFVKQVGREATTPPASAAISPSPLGREGRGEGFGTLREYQLREYQLLAKLGEGGMGAVYKARHSKLDKIVALKVLPADKMNHPQAVARFEREMRAVGKLDHPHLIRAHDAGEVNGTHFLVMEYVAGSDLAALVKQHGPLPIADACELIRQAAIGLAYAHANGLVHRDIKPSNLMLAAESGGRQPPVVKVLDLGLALLAEQEGELTATDQMMGTLDYMAPEQGGDSHAVDRRADIYSLGATLYKLLTGRAPFAADAGATLMQKLMALATQPPTPIQSLRPDIPARLAALVAHMLAKSPADRPATCDEVAALLAPFAAGHHLAALAGLPSALPTTQPDTGHDLSNPSTGTVSSVLLPAEPATPSSLPHSKVLAPYADDSPWWRRPWILLVALAFFGLGGFGLYEIILTIRDKDGKEVGKIVVPEGGSVEIKPGEAKQGPPKDGSQLPAAQLSVSPIGASPLDSLDPAQIPAAERFPWQPKELVAVLGEHQQRIWGIGPPLAVRPDGKQFATGGEYDTIYLWDVSTQTIMHRIPNFPNGQRVFSHRGWLAAERGVIDTTTDPPREIRRFPMALDVLAFLPNQDRLLAWPEDKKKLMLLDLSADQPVTLWSLDNVANAVVSVDGRRLAVVSHPDLLVHVYDVLPDGTKHVCALPRQDGRVRDYQYGAGTPGYPVLAFAPDGRLVTIDPKGFLRLWEIGQEQAKQVAQWEVHPESCVRISPDGKRVLVWDQGKVAFWNLSTLEREGEWSIYSSKRTLANVVDAAFLPDGQGYVTCHVSGALRFWDWKENQAIERMPRSPQPHINGDGLGFSADGQAIAFIGEDDRNHLWHIRNGKLTELALDSFIAGMKLKAISPTANQFVAKGDGTTHWGEFDRTTARLNKEGRYSFDFAAYSPDGKLLATTDNNEPGDNDDRIVLWNVATQEQLSEIVSNEELDGIWFADGGRVLLSRLRNGRVGVWHVRGNTLAVATPMNIPNNSPPSMSKDGRAMAIGCGNQVRLFTWQEGRAVEDGICEANGYVMAVAMDPRGLTVASGVESGELAIWDASTRRKLQSWKFPGKISKLQFAPDGRYLLVCNGNGTAYILRLASPGPPTRDDAPPPADPHRALAEWVLSVEGSGLSLPGNVDIGKNRPLPPSGPIEIASITFEGCRITDGELGRVIGIPKLHALNLNRTPITDKGVASLRGFHVNRLWLDQTKVTDGVFDTLATLPVLHSLTLRDTAVTSRGWARLKELTALEEINVTREFSDADIEALVACPSLRVVHLHDTKVTDAGVVRLAGLPGLQQVNLIGTAVTDRGLDALHGAKSLERVQVQVTGTTAAGRTRLRVALPKCDVHPQDDPHRALAEWAVSVKAMGLTVVQGDKELEICRNGNSVPLPEGSFRVNYLALNRCSIADGDLVRFAGITQIHQLELQATAITDAGVAHLRHLSLDGLSLNDTKITDGVFDSLAAMPRLGRLNLQGTATTRKGWSRLKEIRGLLAIAVPSSFGDDDMPCLLDCPQLKQLALAHSRVTDAALAQAAKIKGLSSLNLLFTGVTDRGLEHLEQVQTLQIVQTQQTKVTPAGLARLQGKLPKSHIETDVPERAVAEWLLQVKANFSVDDGKSYPGIQVDGKVVAPLPTGPFSLNFVSLEKCEITDGDLQRFTGLPFLHQLSLGSTPVTNDGIAYLRNLRMNGLSLADTKVTDGVFNTLTAMPDLSTLDLQKTAITSRGWAGLKAIANLQAVKVGPQFADADVRFLLECPKLVSAGLSYSQITDAALPQVAKIKGLSRVFVMNTQVTDEGLAALEGVETLTHVQTQGSRVTHAGRARLRTKLPKCTVE